MNTLRILPVALIGALALVACGGGDDATTTTAPADANEPSTPSSVVTTSEPAPETTAAATVPEVTAGEVTTPEPTTAPAARAGALHVALPGVADALSNPNAVEILDGLGAEHGSTSPAERIAQYGLGSLTHVVVDNAALFELSGSFSAAVPDQAMFDLDQSYFVESGSPDPAALLTSIADVIAATGAYDIETGSQTDDGMTIHSVGLSATNYSDGLPRWNLVAGHLGERDAEWQGVVELHIETSGSAADTAAAIPPALAELNGTAAAEAPVALTAYRYSFDDGINMFSGASRRSASIDYFVDSPDFASAAPAFDAALSPTYGTGEIDDARSRATWYGDGEYNWIVRVGYDDRIEAQITRSTR